MMMHIYKIFFHAAVFLLLLAASFVFSVFICFAESSVRITEILYDADGLDVGKEYVEIINIGPDEIDMTTVKFSERTDAPDHVIKQGHGNPVLQPGDVAVIVSDPDSFLRAYDFDGVVLDTVQFSLLNAGSTVSIKQDGAVLHSVTYISDRDGAQADGNALHVAGDDTISAIPPSIGVVHGIAINESGVSEEVSVSASENENESLSQVKTKGDLALVVVPSVVFPASTTTFSVVRRGREDGDQGQESGSREQEDGGQKPGSSSKPLYGSWNFGDGTFVYGDTVEHSYLHPGAYIIAFQEHIVQDDESGVVSDGSVLQQEVTVNFPQVTVERVDEAFVRLHNHHDFILDVSRWQIVSPNGSSFSFPDNSLASPRGGITVPFFVGAQEDIFFVTAGGGQFSGKNAVVSAAKLKTEEVSVSDTSDDTSDIQDTAEESAVKRDTAASSESSSDKNSFVRSSGFQNVLSSGTSAIVFDYDDGSDRAAEDEVNKMRVLVIWVSLLVVIILIALVPVLLSRGERGRRVDE